MAARSVVNLLPACRWQYSRALSSTANAGVGIKERMRKFILENPYLGPTKAEGLNVPAVREVSLMQEKLYTQMESMDIDNKPRFRELAPNSRENPLLVGSDMERRVMRCMCYPEVNYMRHLVLYRDMPYRCQCGHWFKLVDMERFEQEREKKWQRIKDQPENAKLLEELTEAETELNKLFEKGRGMSTYSLGATDVIEKLGRVWKQYQKAFIEIRKRMDIP